MNKNTVKSPKKDLPLDRYFMKRVKLQSAIFKYSLQKTRQN
jgi:hypothetical protein